jgi:hypothetical protein
MAFNHNQQTEIKNLIRDMLKSEDESVLVKDLLKNTLNDGLLTETLKNEFDIKQSPRLKAGEGGVQITDLQQVNKTGSGDLMLVRKTAQGQDNAITYDNFLNSIGNTAVNGFVATIDDNNVNGIILNPVNGVTIPAYVNFMKVSFISPINSTGQVQIKIGTLPYKNIYALNTTTTAVIKVGDYVEAVLVGTGVFNQTNNANYVYTNDYKVQTYTIDAGGVATTLYLESAYGVLKTTYYEGMTINFTCPINTQGFVRIRIDGLPLIDLIGDIDSGIPFEIFAGNMVQAVYNGISFVPNSFVTADPTVEIPVEPDPNNQDEPIIPQQNQLEFTVGTIGNTNFANLQIAIATLIKKYGNTGGGRRVNLIITSDLTMSSDSITIVNDLSWITLVANSQNNTIKIIDDVSNPNSNHKFFTCSQTGNLLNIKSGTTITYDARGLNSIFIFGFHADNLIFLKDINISVLNGNLTSQFITLSGNCKAIFNNVTLTGTHVSIFLFSSKCTLSLIGCNFNNYSLNNIIVNSTNSEISIENCDLTKSGVSNVSDIKINYYCSITQINSKAKSNYPANTNNNECRYSVVGDQNTLGKS